MSLFIVSNCSLLCFSSLLYVYLQLSMCSCSLPAIPLGKHRKMKRHKTRYNVSQPDLNICQHALLHERCNLLLMVIILELSAKRWLCDVAQSCAVSALDILTTGLLAQHIFQIGHFSGNNIISSLTGLFGPPICVGPSNTAGPIDHTLQI